MGECDRSECCMGIWVSWLGSLRFEMERNMGRTSSYIISKRKLSYHMSAIWLRISPTLLRMLVCLKQACSRLNTKATPTTFRNETRTPEINNASTDSTETVRKRSLRVIRLPRRMRGFGDVAWTHPTTIKPTTKMEYGLRRM